LGRSVESSDPGSQGVTKLTPAALETLRRRLFTRLGKAACVLSGEKERYCTAFMLRDLDPWSSRALTAICFYQLDEAGLNWLSDRNSLDVSATEIDLVKEVSIRQIQVHNAQTSKTSLLVREIFSVS